MQLADLSTMKVRDLRKLASEKGVSGRNDMNRGQLIAALEVPILEDRVANLETRLAALERESHKVNPFDLIGGK